MRAYKTSDGGRVKGRTARDVVKALRAGSRDPEPSMDKFMRALATRAFRQTGLHIPVDTPAKFIAGLERLGLLIKE